MGSFKKLNSIDIVVDDKFKDGIAKNLSDISSIIDSRTGFYYACRKLVDSGVLNRAGREDIDAISTAITMAMPGVGDAKVLLHRLTSQMQDYMDVENIPVSIESAPDFSEINTATYQDMIAMLKTYMYGSHSKAKRAQKDAKSLFHNRELAMLMGENDTLDRMYSNSVNFQYVLSLNEILTKVGPYRGIAESIIRAAKTCDKIVSAESELVDND